LYVTSLYTGAGKTLLCAGLGRLMQAEGKHVGFLKPVIADIKGEGRAKDSDPEFLKQALALDEPLDSLSPVIDGQEDLGDALRRAYARVSPGKDVVIIEGVWRQRPGGRPFETVYEAVKALDARVIVVEPYTEVAAAAPWNDYKAFGEHLLGVVLNRVPRSRVAPLYNRLSAALKQAGVALLGVLPEDRTLLAPTVGELAAGIGGEILNCADRSAELVENLMLGALTVDPGVDYFGRKPNKAAVLRGERPDMQLAALETSTRCLVLTGGTPPISSVLNKANDRGVPVILVGGDTLSTVNRVETTVGGARFNQEKKLPKLEEIMRQHVNLQAVYQGLGLAG